MSEGKKKRKKRVVRSKAERIADMERKVVEEKAKLAFEGIKTAIAEDKVSSENKKEYRMLLRQLKGIEKAPEVLAEFGNEEASKTAEKVRQKLIAKLQNLMEDGPDSDEEEDDDEEDEDDDEEDEDDEEDDEEG